MEEPADLLTISQAARYLGVPPSSIINLLEEGRFPGVNIRGRWHIRRHELESRRELFQWQKRNGAIGMVSLDPLSQLVMTKVGERFGLGTKIYQSAQEVVSAVERCDCAMVVLNETLPDLDTSQCYAALRALNTELPTAVMCDEMEPEDYRKFLFRGGPVTFIHRPIQFHHAQRMMEHFGFPMATATML